MEKQVRVLIIEDNPADALRVVRELERHGMAFESVLVETKADLLRAIGEQPPDVILSDHGLPSFSGFARLGQS